MGGMVAFWPSFHLTPPLCPYILHLYPYILTTLLVGGCSSRGASGVEGDLGKIGFFGTRSYNHPLIGGCRSGGVYTPPGRGW